MGQENTQQSGWALLVNVNWHCTCTMINIKTKTLSLNASILQFKSGSKNTSLLGMDYMFFHMAEQSIRKGTDLWGFFFC